MHYKMKMKKAHDCNKGVCDFGGVTQLERENLEY